MTDILAFLPVWLGTGPGDKPGLVGGTRTLRSTCMLQTRWLPARHLLMIIYP